MRRLLLLVLLMSSLFIAFQATAQQGKQLYVVSERSDKVSIFESPSGESKLIKQVKRNTKVLVLEVTGEWARVRTKGGTVGYVSIWLLADEKTTSKPEKHRVRGSFRIVARAYRVIPGEQTTYLPGRPASSQTTCFGSGRDYGYSTSITLDCQTVYKDATSYPLTWRWADVYNIVESPDAEYEIDSEHGLFDFRRRPPVTRNEPALPFAPLASGRDRARPRHRDLNRSAAQHQPPRLHSVTIAAPSGR